MTGTIYSFIEPRGFGFIACEDGSELYFHCTDVSAPRSSIRPGMKVEFDLVRGAKGPKAVLVRLAGPAVQDTTATGDEHAHLSVL